MPLVAWYDQKNKTKSLVEKNHFKIDFACTNFSVVLEKLSLALQQIRLRSSSSIFNNLHGD